MGSLDGGDLLAGKGAGDEKLRVAATLVMFFIVKSMWSHQILILTMKNIVKVPFFSPIRWRKIVCVPKIGVFPRQKW
ncbi:hypothetical protein [Paenibacillus eucommiae]|uniref:Uncharacterized protein n=1 Tax=Paenibacillus eucommiae TaxID=1355755 RepID=A0ABS4JB75_9BACL|nr:hypothetical protein [Paenibacillus eucommiae]MBP1997065.1 hypothetical protein [Paenibacillus eucommiae]